MLNLIFGHIKMNKISLKIYFLLVVYFTGHLMLYGNQPNKNQTGEKITLFSDRTLYMAGEKILFSAIIQTESGTRAADTSRILYCEIISRDGKKLSGNKYLINNFIVSGNITIPNDVITGWYYLRAYTKFMRNSGPASYYYTGLKIVNAGSNEFQVVTNENNSSISSTGINNQVKAVDSFLISSDRSKYTTRDKVLLSISKTDSAKSDWKLLSLSVVPEFSISKIESKLPEFGKYEKNEFYYPESRGLSITGKIIDNKSGLPLPGRRINLSILGKGRDFVARQSDSTGKFYIPLPDYTGFRDLFLSTDNTLASDPKILIDNDYCTIPVHLPSKEFSMTPQERETAYNMAVNVQLESFFKDDSIPVIMDNRLEGQTFYGKPNEILYLNKYVLMPSLEDYFTELLNTAKVRIRQGGKYFKVLGPQAGLSGYDPLILVDMVAIADPSKALAIPPLNISRIEVVNSLYVKGDQIYGGIINIISKQSDFAGMDLPSSGVFINYGFLADSIYNSVIFRQKQHYPDTRNTLFWEPKLEFIKASPIKISFTTSDTPGRYQILLNGINSKGEVLRQISVIDVIK
jgi:hypothetical protein